MHEQAVKRVRGKGKKPAMVLLSLRLEPDVYKFFNEVEGNNMQAKIRNALKEYIDIKESQNG